MSRLRFTRLLERDSDSNISLKLWMKYHSFVQYIFGPEMGIIVWFGDTYVELVRYRSYLGTCAYRSPHFQD
jgi:hypothetical protein